MKKFALMKNIDYLLHNKFTLWFYRSIMSHIMHLYSNSNNNIILLWLFYQQFWIYKMYIFEHQLFSIILWLNSILIIQLHKL